MKNTVLTFRERKERGEKISMLTCYDYSTAKLMDGHIDAILVGDSLGNVMLGYENTLPVTVDHMITYGGAVARACRETMVVVDLPFMSYQISAEQALENAGRIVKETGCAAVKLEGGEAVLPQIRAITAAGIPVVAHLGLTPQSVHALGGHKVQGKSEEAARALLESAKAVEEAGAFALTLECVPAPLAKLISEKLTIPTIGIGAGAGCDGQVLVYMDMLGMFRDFKPKFVKRFGSVGDAMEEAFRAYDSEVKAGVFPAEEHTFHMANEELLERLY